MDDKISEKLDQYLQGELTGEELKRFEELLRTNAELEQEHQFRHQLQSAYTQVKSEELKEKFNEIEYGFSKKKEMRRYYWGIAATVALLFVAFTYFFFTNFSPNEDKLYATYYEAYPNYEAPVQRQGELNEPWALLYESGDYQKAFQALERENQFTDWVLFYQAQCKLASEDWGEALRLFSEVHQIPQSEYREPSLWYAALASIKLENYQVAKSYLVLLKDSPDYGQKSANLLQSL